MPIGKIRFTLPSRPGQKTRLLRQQVRVKWTCPPGKTPLEWRLLTNREVSDFDAVVEFIDWYRARWEIETFFHVLKNGCRVEALQLATIEKLERALAVYMVVAWRIARLMRLAVPALIWMLNCCLSEKNGKLRMRSWKKAYPEAPTLNEVVRLVTMLGAS